jgi:hypothetical protein
MKKYLLFLALPLLLSCSIQGFTNDYKHLEPLQKEKIIPLTSFSDAREGHIYEINASQLREEIAKKPKALVYVFTNGCTSKYCKPLRIYELYAAQHGYDLFLVMNGYRELDATLEQPVCSPLYAIDCKHYDTKFRSNYTRYFENELAGKPMKEKEKVYLGNLFFFNDGKLEKILIELPQS